MEKKIKVMIVDDEVRARTVLSSLLTGIDENVEIVGMAGSVTGAIELIEQRKPDMVFLDVQMPGGNGFTLFDHIENPDFEVIFTTAYNQYAIDAIKKSALDYILKPVDVDELKLALEKFRSRAKAGEEHVEDSFLILDYEDAGKQNMKIAIPNMKGLELIKVKSILYCSAASNYCEFHLENGERHVVSQTLKSFEEKLGPCGFLRIHDSYMVNLSKVGKYLRGRGGNVELTDGTVLPVSRSRKEALMEVLKS